jgi:D-threo-aldose 1-dehydrogenase
MNEQPLSHPAPAVPSGLGLGTAPLGGLFADVSPQAARATVEAAWAIGVRYFDTAPLYGSVVAESRLGDALAGRPREEFIVSTKVGRLLKPGDPSPQFVGAPPLEPVFDFSPAGVRRSLAESLERLQLDRVDIALLHDPEGHEDAARSALDTVRELVAGVGVGTNVVQTALTFVTRGEVDLVLLAGRYTLLDRAAGNELLPLCAERGVPVVAAGAFNSGVLAGGTTFDYEAAPPAVLARRDMLDAMCARHGVPLAAAAIQFPLRHPAVVSIVVGARSSQEIEEDARLLHHPVPEELWSELESTA